MFIFLKKIDKFKFYKVEKRGMLRELYARLRGMPGAILVQSKCHNPFNPDVKNKNFYAMCCATRAIPLACLNFKDLNTHKYYSSLEKINFPDRKIVYISLHYYPEASIDYVSKTISLIDHDKVVVDLLSKFSSKYVFLLKEHPSMYNFRKLNFYEKIKMTMKKT